MNGGNDPEKSVKAALGSASLMEGQGQGQGGGGLGIDFNTTPPGPETLCPREFKLSQDKLVEIVMAMEKAPRSDLLPNYEAVEPRERRAYVQGVISEFLRQHSPEDIQSNLQPLQVFRMSSPFSKSFEKHLRKQKSQGEE